MPEREYITDADVCALASRWRVSLDTMQRVWTAAQDFEELTGGRRVSIISGFRTKDQQARLNRQGRPTAPDDRSTHRSCPATGVDVSLGLFPSGFLKVTWGNAALRNGLRWGGGGPIVDAIPVDFGHVDMGPR